MSISVALQTALTGLQANESIIQVISNNVANANTEGYTRKIANQVSRTVDGEGRGVDISVLSRVVDERVLEDLRETLGALGDARAQQFYYNRILDQFGTLANDSTLGATITDLATAMQALAASPNSTAHRTEVLSAATTLVAQINAMSEKVQTLRFDADKEITDKIDLINAELEKIGELNGKIESRQAVGEQTVELEDLRDQALNKISGLIDIRYFKRTSGEIVVTLPDGRVLVDKVPKLLSHAPAGALSPDLSYPNNGITGIISGNADITTTIKTGELHGLIQARDTILPNLQTQLDQLTKLLRDEINAVHNAGTSLPPPNKLTGTRNFTFPATDTVTLSAGVRIAVIDRNGNFVAHHDLAAGTYSIKQIENAININLTGFATATTSTDGPLSITATNSTNGIAIVDLGSPLTVTHTDGVTAYDGFSSYFGLNDFLVTTGRVQGESTVGIASRLQVRSDIVANPTLLARGALTSVTSPAPKAGDPGVGLGDGSNAQIIADKFFESLQFSAAGKLPLTTATFAGYASEILSTNAVGAAAAEKTMTFKTALFKELSFRNTSISGVNLDEELRNLILYENAYAATARLVSVADELLKLLIGIV